MVRPETQQIGSMVPVHQTPPEAVIRTTLRNWLSTARTRTAVTEGGRSSCKVESRNKRNRWNHWLL